MVDTNLEVVSPTIAPGVPGCTGGFTVVAASAHSATASPRGEVGDYGKELGDLGVACCEGGRERRVGDDKSINGVILMEGGVCEVVDRNDHRVVHLHLRGLVFHALVGNVSEPDKLTFLEKGPAPHRFPTYSGLLVVGKPYPPAPHVIHATGCYSVLSTHSDHGGLGDQYIHVFCHLLAEFLFTDVDGHSAADVDGLIEGVKVSFDLVLEDCRVVVHGVVVGVADGDPVESLFRVIECNEHPFVECGVTDVDGDATGVYILGPVDSQ